MRPLHLLAAACVARAQNAVLLCGSAHTGTHHVKLALEALGLSNIVVDHPQNARYEAHLAAHPSSKVLLTTRDPSRWRTSIQQSRPEAALEKAQARREAYEKGVRAAATHLLELDLEAGATYGALCAFLNIDQGCPAATDTLPRNLAMQKKTPAPQNHESVSSLLATARSTRNVVACKAALLVYPGFEEIHREAIDRADAEWPLGWELREFLPEVFVVDGALHHPCRAPFDPAQNLPLAATPRLFVVPAAWRVLSLVQGAQELLKRAWALLDKVVAGRYWEPLMEHHVLLHISTARVVDAWGRRLMDHRLIVPHLEGPGGDRRKEVLVPGPRTVVAPYFVEPPRLVAAALAAAGLAAAPRSRVFLRAAGQKGARARHAVAAAFRNVAGADVTLVENRYEGVSQVRGETVKGASSDATRRHFLDTASRTRNATFCLVPSGYTASSRRFYEALAAGCIPVVVSDQFPLPFRDALDWNRAVVRHGQRDVASLPQKLAAIGAEEVARRRAAALELFDRVDYASGAAVAMLLDRFAALVAPGTRSRPGPDVSVEIVEKGPLRFSKGTQDAARAKQCLPAGLVAGALGVDATRIAGSERALRVLLDKAAVLADTAPRGDCDRKLFLAAAAAALRMAHPDEVVIN